MKEEDNTFTVRELGEDGQTLNEWKVSFTDLSAEVPVPHVAEAAAREYSLKAETVDVKRFFYTTSLTKATVYSIMYRKFIH